MTSLMDAHMPEMDGYEATVEIRRIEGRGRVHYRQKYETAERWPCTGS